MSVVDYVQGMREEAAARFAEVGWPTTRLEEWKYTSLTSVAKVAWRVDSRAVDPELKTESSLAASATEELIFYNGRFVRRSANMRGWVKTIVEHPYEALAEDALGRIAKDGSMVVLNVSHMQDGALIEIPAGDVVDGFIHLLFIGDGDGIWSHPHNLISVGPNAQVTIVETYVGSGRYFTNAVTEIVAMEGAVVDHYKIVRESDDAFHVGTVQAYQWRGSSVTQRNVTVGGKLVRNDIRSLLDGEGASVVLDGLFTGSGSQHIDNHTFIDHAAPHCESLELYKGVLDGSARGIFDGTIIVREGAVKTVSRQTNHNLLLSETAIADSKPTLVIHNDDVKCNHGSTIGQLNEEALFYLRSRGIDEDAARRMLVHAFADQIVDRMKVASVREETRRALFEQMPERLPERRENTR